jgi:hypothetical protein
MKIEDKKIKSTLFSNNIFISYRKRMKNKFLAASKRIS